MRSLHGNVKQNICDTGSQNLSLVVFWLFTSSYLTLHLLQNIFTEAKYLVSN